MLERHLLHPALEMYFTDGWMAWNETSTIAVDANVMKFNYSGNDLSPCGYSGDITLAKQNVGSIVTPEIVASSEVVNTPENVYTKIKEVHTRIFTRVHNALRKI